MSQKNHDLPGNWYKETPVGTVAADAAAQGVLFVAPYDCKIQVKVMTSSNIETNVSNYATISVIDGGATGTATTSLGTFVTQSTGITANTLTDLISTAKAIDEGDVVRFAVAQTASGVNLTGLSLITKYWPS